MTKPPWTPEHPVDRALAAELIAAQFPEVSLAELAHLGEGWDNDVWQAGDRVFRFPRRDIAVALLETEARALPALSEALPVPVPRPRHFGRPSPAFPYPWLGYQMLPGESGDCLALTDDERVALAAPLGHFLRALHAVAPDPAWGVPADRFRTDVPRYRQLMEDRLAALAPQLPAGMPAAMRALAAMAEPLPEAARARVCLTHGDLYLRHLLFDPARRWTAVIDWGDLNRGHPLADLTIAFTALPEAARPAFFDAYGSVDADDRLRARFIGMVRHGLSLLAYALDRGDARLAAEARRGVALALGPELYSPP